MKTKPNHLILFSLLVVTASAIGRDIGEFERPREYFFPDGYQVIDLSSPSGVVVKEVKGPAKANIQGKWRDPRFEGVYYYITDWSLQQKKAGKKHYFIDGFSTEGHTGKVADLFRAIHNAEKGGSRSEAYNRFPLYLWEARNEIPRLPRDRRLEVANRIGESSLSIDGELADVYFDIFYEDINHFMTREAKSYYLATRDSPDQDPATQVLGSLLEETDNGFTSNFGTALKARDEHDWAGTYISCFKAVYGKDGLFHSIGKAVGVFGE